MNNATDRVVMRDWTVAMAMDGAARGATRKSRFRLMRMSG